MTEAGEPLVLCKLGEGVQQGYREPKRSNSGPSEDTKQLIGIVLLCVMALAVPLLELSQNNVSVTVNYAAPSSSDFASATPLWIESAYYSVRELLHGALGTLIFLACGLGALVGVAFLLRANYLTFTAMPNCTKQTPPPAAPHLLLQQQLQSEN